MFIILLIGLMIGTNMYADQWTNWAKNQQCSVTIVTPKNTQELIDIVKKASKEQTTIRAYGTGHSWSNIVCANGYLANTEKLNKVISVDKAQQQVTVQAGIKLKDLNEQLTHYGLCLSNQAAVTAQSLAGVVSTATHGSGKTGTFASFITKVQLLTADGTLKTFSETENADLFPAARTSIGSLGIMTELTLQCEPLFYVQAETKSMTWQDFVKNYETLLKDNDFMQSYWYAADNSVEVSIHNRVDTTKDKKRAHQHSGPSYRMLSGGVGPFYMEEEIAIARSRFIEAAQKARTLLEKYYQKNAMFSGILFRFVTAEKNNLLSPASDKDVVFFSVTTSSMSGYEDFYKEFYQAMLPYEGRPHWGKINYLTKEDVQKLYGQNYTRFVEIRKKIDPQGLFSSEFTKRIFGW